MSDTILTPEQIAEWAHLDDEALAAHYEVACLPWMAPWLANDLAAEIRRRKTEAERITSHPFEGQAPGSVLCMRCGEERDNHAVRLLRNDLG